MSSSSSSSSSSPYPETGSSMDILMSDDSSLLVFAKLAEDLQAYEDTATSKRKYVKRDRGEAMQLLMRDYFNEEPLYDDEHVHNTCRLPKPLFLEIVEKVKANGHSYFQEGVDARQKPSFTTLQKCLSALQQLADGGVAHQNDKYFKMAGRTARECLQYFCDIIYTLYHKEFIRKPTSHDVAALQRAHEHLHHIPGMLGSIDCTHFKWKMCPTRLHGQYKRGNHKHPTIMLEAWVSYDLWFWHSYFGAPETNNDINVLNTSNLFQRERDMTAPPSEIDVNGHHYNRGYLLADGGYPNWAVFVKAYQHPVEPPEKKFKQLQEAARKDVERAFGVLKGRWGILNRTMRPKKKNIIIKIVYTCIILHNMLIKYDGRAISPVHIRDPPIQPQYDEDALMKLRDDDTCARLLLDLTEHVWPQDLSYLNDPPEE